MKLMRNIRLLLALALLGSGISALAWDKAKDLHEMGKKADSPQDRKDYFCEASDLKPKNKDYKKDCDDATAVLETSKNNAAAAARKIEEDKSNAAFEAAKSLLDHHDWDGSRAKFKEVTAGPHTSEAQDYLARGIKTARDKYEKEMAANKLKQQDSSNYKTGNTAFNSGQYDAAESALSAISSDFPEKAKADDDLKAIHLYRNAMAEGTQLAAQKKFEEAKRAYNRAFIITARTGPAASEAQKQEKEMERAIAKGNDEHEKDKALIGSLQDFYQGDLDAIKKAESELQSYVDSKGPTKKGLAYFYLGASQLEHYYLLDPKESGQSTLKRQAIDNFKKAKQVREFAPPANSVAPKILEEYKNAA